MQWGGNWRDIDVFTALILPTGSWGGGPCEARWRGSWATRDPSTAFGGPPPLQPQGRKGRDRMSTQVSLNRGEALALQRRLTSSPDRLALYAALTENGTR